MIRQFKKTGDIKAGNWFNATSVQRDQICAQPRQATKVSGSRVYYTDADGKTTYRIDTSILFVCDTQEEAQQMRAISEAQFRDLEKIKAHYSRVVQAILTVNEKRHNLNAMAGVPGIDACDSEGGDHD